MPCVMCTRIGLFNPS